MQKLNQDAMLEITGGSRATAIIGGVSCAGIAVLAGFFSWGIGAAILGPTCIGMIVGTVVD